MKGLPNVGNTCYFNAALQCLAYCPNLANYLLAPDCDTDVNPKKKGASTLAMALISFVREYWTVHGTAANPTEVYTAFRKACKGFGAGVQHDAHEALMAMLDKLHDGMSGLKPGGLAVSGARGVHNASWTASLRGVTSVVTEVFRGQMEVRVVAPGYTNVSYDHFTCLPLALDKASSMAQCLRRHMASEEVSDFKVGDAMVSATVSKKFTYLPRILVIQLKRFDGSAKMDRFVDYATELDLSMHCIPECPPHYQLFGVCFHRGSPTQGHYTACCEVKGQWHMMDDDGVAPLGDINMIIQRDAYVLLYKRLG
jgi:ubiquitin C-terminal hydrolase